MVARGRGDGKGTRLLNGTGFPSGPMKMFWKETPGMLSQNVEVLNANQLCTSKGSRG